MTFEAIELPTRRRAVRDLDAAWTAFIDLIEGLTPAGWDRATRCTGWCVRDVAGHVTGMALDAASRRPTTDPNTQAAALRDQSPREMATLLGDAATGVGRALASLGEESWAAPFGSRFPTLAEAVQTLLHDVYVHGDDVADALGTTWDAPGEWASLNTIAIRLARRGWSAATLIVDGQPVHTAHDPAAPTVHVHAHDFVLVATGRYPAAILGLDEGVNIYGEDNR